MELRKRVMNRVQLFAQTLGEHKRENMGGGCGFNRSPLVSTTAVPCWRISLAELGVDRLRRQWGPMLQNGSKNAVQRIKHLDSWVKKSHRELTKTKIHRSIGN